MSSHRPLYEGTPPANAYVLPQHKVVYLSVTKAACTSMRWMIADLAGEDFSRFYRSSAAHQTRLMTIHTVRGAWKHAKALTDLTDDERSAISPDNGWFVFAVVRDPRTRLWSAWQSKFLVRQGTYLTRFRDEPWFPRVPEKPTDVLEDWATFVRATPWLTNPDLVSNFHFRPQVDSVHPERVNYTRVYDIKEIPSLTEDLHAHLRGLAQPDLDKDLYLPRGNETPLRMGAEHLDDELAGIIEDAYAADFAAFGDRWSRAGLQLRPDTIHPEALGEIRYHVVANERIADLSTELRSARLDVKQLRAELAAPVAPPPEPTLRALSRRKAVALVRRARWAITTRGTSVQQ